MKFFLSRSKEGSLILSTHSPVIVAEAPVESVYLAVKDREGGTVVHQMSESEEVRDRVVTELGVKPSHSFDANVLILVEGVYDVAVYAAIAIKLRISGCEFIDTEGWTNFRYYAAARLARRSWLSKTTFGIFDGDTLDSSNAKSRKRAMKRLTELGLDGNLTTISHRQVEGFLLVPEVLAQLREGVQVSEVREFLGARSSIAPKDCLKACLEHFGLGYYTPDLAAHIVQLLPAIPAELEALFARVHAASS